MTEPLFYRSFELDRRGLDKEARTATLSFSSEAPVERWFGDEILLHGAKNVDLSRLTTVGAALYGHQTGLADIIGPVRSARIDKTGRRGVAEIGFDDDDTGNRALAKVESGSLRGVSFAYRIHEARQLYEKESWIDPDTGREYAGPALIATRWEAYEISLTPVPADPSVGVGRSTRSLEGIHIFNRDIGDSDMDEKKIKDMIEEGIGPLRDAISRIPTAEKVVEQVRAQLAEEATPKMQVTPEQLRDITGRASAVSLECKSRVTDMALDGKTEGELLRHITEAALGKRPDAADNGDGDDKRAAGDGQPQPPAKLSEVDDDLLARSLSAPFESF